MIRHRILLETISLIMHEQTGWKTSKYLTFFLIFQCVVLAFSCALLAKSVIPLWVRLVINIMLKQYFSLKEKGMLCPLSRCKSLASEEDPVIAYMDLELEM